MRAVCVRCVLGGITLGFSDDRMISEKTVRRRKTLRIRQRKPAQHIFSPSTVAMRSVGNMQLSTNMVSEGNNDCWSVPEHEFRDDNRSRKLCMVMIIVFSVTCVLASIIVVIYTVKTEPCHNNDTLPVTESTEYGFMSYNKSVGDLRIVSRKTWMAQPPTHPADHLQHPVPYVIILHTATEDCSTSAECVFLVRHIQTFHMENNGWWDIAYNFLVGGDGLVYQARGWDHKGAFAYGYNNISIGIAFMGTFSNRLPTSEQIAAGRLLIEKGVETGRIATDYKLLTHRQVSGTNSPGDRFFEEIKTWPHWAQVP